MNRIITDEGKAIVQGMDDDKDALVERREFIEHASKLLDDNELAMHVFSALDRNADGAIPIPEYLRIWGKWARTGQKPAERRVAALRSQLATTRTPGEKPTDVGNARPNARRGPPSVDEIFERFDRNKDGKLQKQELPEFAQQFILPADVDGDDMVARNELEAHRKRRRPTRESKTSDPPNSESDR